VPDIGSGPTVYLAVEGNVTKDGKTNRAMPSLPSTSQVQLRAIEFNAASTAGVTALTSSAARGHSSGLAQAIERIRVKDTASSETEITGAWCWRHNYPR
jgi:hypothetical protein